MRSASGGSITDEVMEKYFDFINQVPEKKIIVWLFYIKCAVHPRDKKSILYYCVKYHSKEIIAITDSVKGVVR